MASSAPDHPFREFERSGGERAATAYADTFATVTRLFTPRLLDAVGIREHLTLLDVACGPGLVASIAASRGAVATGVDFSPNMVAEARRRHPQLTFREADAEALPFADATFDAVVISFGIHHFPFPLRALAEARRVLRTGGRLGLTTWAPPDEHVLQKLVIDAVREVGDAGAALPVAPGGAVNEIATCVRLLKESGFDAGSIRAEKMEAHVQIASARHLIDLLVAETVRLSAMLKSQPPERLPAILAVVEKAMVPYRTDNHFRIPAAAILAVGVRS